MSYQNYMRKPQEATRSTKNLGLERRKPRFLISGSNSNKGESQIYCCFVCSLSKKEERWKNPRPKTRNPNPNTREENGKKREGKEKKMEGSAEWWRAVGKAQGAMQGLFGVVQGSAGRLRRRRVRRTGYAAIPPTPFS